MTTPMIICVITFVLMMVSFAWNKFPMGVTSGTALVILVLTGCIDAGAALSGFGNANVIIIVGMFVIGAGFKRTSLITKITQVIRKFTGGNFQLAYKGIIILAVILTSVITSPAVAYAIVFPIMDSICDEFHVSRSKVQFPLAATCISCCAILPFGFAISEAAVFDGLMTTYGFTGGFTAMDFTIGRLPMMLVIVLWAFFIAQKFTPEQPIVPISGSSKSAAETKALPPLSDTLGSIVFVCTILALIFNAQLGVAAWIVIIAGCMLNVICGVLTGQEAINSMAIDLGMLFVGANAVAQALVNTGAADLIGQKIASLLGGHPSSLMLCTIFFIVPFILTQFMQNQGVMNIFAPICLLTCSAIGADPKGCLVLICAGSLTAFMTPSATSAIPIVMGAGGYDVKSLTKMSWVLSLMLAVTYILYVNWIMPAY